MKIGGDTLALDADVRRQIESEMRKLADRFPNDQMDAQVTIQEDFDPVHGHRVRCELSARLASGHQMVVREARKTAGEAIVQVFTAARRSVRRLRRQNLVRPTPASRSAVHAAQAAGR